MKLSASILSADFSNLASELKDAENAGCDLIHIDVADGSFVPNITLGAPIVEALRDKTKLPFDVHLMIKNPENHVESFLKAGADILTIHIESTDKALKTLDFIKSSGCLAGVALNPETPVTALEYLVPYLDQVTILGVVPGFGGQKLLPETKRKVSDLKKFLVSHHSTAEIEVDGGIKADNIASIIDAGCDIAVAGSAVFCAADRKMAVLELKSAARREI